MRFQVQLQTKGVYLGVEEPREGHGHGVHLQGVQQRRVVLVVRGGPGGHGDARLDHVFHGLGAVLEVPVEGARVAGDLRPGFEQAHLNGQERTCNTYDERIRRRKVEAKHMKQNCEELRVYRTAKL